MSLVLVHNISVVTDRTCGNARMCTDTLHTPGMLDIAEGGLLFSRMGEEVEEDETLQMQESFIADLLHSNAVLAESARAAGDSASSLHVQALEANNRATQLQEQNKMLARDLNSAKEAAAAAKRDAQAARARAQELELRIKLLERELVGGGVQQKSADQMEVEQRAILS
jgi:prophage tail gpP-like protein